MLNFCLICSALLTVTVIFVITVFFSFLCVSTILANKDDRKPFSRMQYKLLSNCKFKKLLQQIATVFLEVAGGNLMQDYNAGIRSLGTL